MKTYLILFLAAILLIGCVQVPGQKTGTGSGQAAGTGTGQGASGSGAASGTAAGSGSDSGSGAAGGTGTTTNPGSSGSGEGASGSSSGTTSSGSGSSGSGSGSSEPTGTVSNLKSEEMSFKSFGWNISGTLYKADSTTPRKAVILIPMRGKTRDSYPQSFVSDIHDKIPETVVLALDMRGHGKSVNLGTYDSFQTEDYKAMKDDIVTAKKTLKDKYPTLERFYLVGASIGSSAAILAAQQDSDFGKVVMISPGMEYQGVKIERAVKDYIMPVLAVASANDRDAYNTALWVYSTSGSAQREKKIYEGLSAHGTDIFGQEGSDTPLSSVITNFLKQ